MGTAGATVADSGAACSLAEPADLSAVDAEESAVERHVGPLAALIVLHDVSLRQL